MNEPLQLMMNKYQCKTVKDYENALKEIIQEIALLGLWRSKFFEKAAFYGGTALRIFHGLNRFSEDLDFTLLKKNKRFSLETYNDAVAIELQSYGFLVTVETKKKLTTTAIESAFIKTEAKQQLLLVKTPEHLTLHLPKSQLLKIKMEVDTDPPLHFSTEVKTLLQPIPFNVRIVSLSDLFAGKVHAMLCRQWQQRVKGRDWYDFYWYIANNIPLNCDHLRARLIQSTHWPAKKTLDAAAVKMLLLDKINELDFKAAKQDVLPFINDKASLDLWSNDFFSNLIHQMHFQN